MTFDCHAKRSEESPLLLLLCGDPSEACPEHSERVEVTVEGLLVQAHSSISEGQPRVDVRPPPLALVGGTKNTVSRMPNGSNW